MLPFVVLLASLLLHRTVAFPRDLERRSPLSSAPDVTTSSADYNNVIQFILSLNLTPSSPVTVGRKPIPDSAHPFQPPGPSDIRGGCPGLNIMANYGYINRTGITNIYELMYGMQEMLGLGADTAAVITALAIKTAVDITTLELSIGQTDSRTNGPLSGLFGPVPGFFSKETHNKFEVDGSLSRVDAYFAQGNTDQFTSDHWSIYRTLAVNKYGGLMTTKFCGEARFTQYTDCRNNNPTCQWAVGEQLALYVANPFTSKIMASAAANGSSGIPDIKSVESFFGIIENPDGSFSRGDNKLLPGPDGFWYRRVPLTLVEQTSTLTDTYLAYPVEFGRNNGTLGHWDSDLTQFQNVEQSGLTCYLLQQIRDPKQNSRYSGDSQLTAALGTLLQKILQPAFDEFACQ